MSFSRITFRSLLVLSVFCALQTDPSAFQEAVASQGAWDIRIDTASIERILLDPETILELIAAWEDYRDDVEMRCAIITGAGDTVFCAGADLAKLIPLLTGAKKPETEADKKVAADPMAAGKAMLVGLDARAST